MYRKLSLLILLAFWVIVANAQSQKRVYQNGVIYLKLKDNSNIQLLQPGAAGAAFDQVLKTFNVTQILQPFKGISVALDHTYKIHFTSVSLVGSFMKSLSAFTFVDYVEQIPLYYATFKPNDLDSIQQYSLKKINASKAWDISKGNSKVVIAIVDNAVCITHNDLKDNIWTNSKEIPNNGKDDDENGYVDDVNGFDVANHDNNPNPPAGLSLGNPFNHGTHVAGIASATTNNGIGVASIGYSCKIMPIKCSLSDSSGETLSATDEGIAYAIGAGANIINMSFGSAVESSTQLNLLQSAASKGIILIAAAGNDDSNVPSFPASDLNVISVGATEATDTKADYSSYGVTVDVMAPGSSIRSTVASTNDSYASYSGTSMASPLTAGLCGLMLSANPNLTRSQIESYLENGCEKVNNSNILYTGQLGSGRINAYNSMLQVANMSGISTHNAINPLQVYPNPNNGSFRIYADLANTMVTVYNGVGQMVVQRMIEQGSYTTIDIPGAIPGLYFVRAKTENATYESKMIVR